ncbi:hypothetical protein JCM19000A_08020 [Silvimonas sp. JCM 19000]
MHTLRPDRWRVIPVALLGLAWPGHGYISFHADTPGSGAHLTPFKYVTRVFEGKPVERQGRKTSGLSRLGATVAGLPAVGRQDELIVRAA